MMDEGGGGQSLGGAKSVLFVVMAGDGFGFFVDSIIFLLIKDHRL